MTFRYFLKAKFLKLPFRICSHNARILFTLYILKCSKAVSGWMGMGMEISVSTFSKSTGANKDGGTPHICRISFLKRKIEESSIFLPPRSSASRWLRVWTLYGEWVRVVAIKSSKRVSAKVVSTPLGAACRAPDKVTPCPPCSPCPLEGVSCPTVAKKR